MKIEISTSSPEPIYRQIAEQIGLATALGTLSPGSALPSVRELAQQLVLNPNTVFRAYTKLERDGIIYTRRGVGTFVAERRDILSRAERDRILSASADRMITQAVHLGVSEQELLDIVRRRARAFRLRSSTHSREQHGRRPRR